MQESDDKQEKLEATMLSLDDLVVLKRVLRPVSAYWVEIGDQLGMTSVVGSIQTAPGNYNPPAKFRDLLYRWLTREHPTPTLETLCQALRNDDEILGGAVMARELEKRFKSPERREVLFPQPSSPHGSTREEEPDLLFESDLVEVLEEVDQVSYMWYEIGLMLGLSPHLLDMIRANNRANICAPRDSLIEVLRRWLMQTGDPPTWSRLVEVLRSPLIGDRALAAKLEKEHCPDTRPQTQEHTSSADTHSQTEEQTSSEAETVRPQKEQHRTGVPNVDTNSQTEECTSSEAQTVRPQKVDVPQKQEHRTGPFCTMWWMVLCTSIITTVLLAVILWLFGAISLDTFKDLRADRPTQAGPYHYLGAKQSFRNLIVIERGNRPSLPELHHLIIPGQKEVKVIQEVSTKWKKLALELGIELSLVESIGSRYNSDSEEDCEFMLRKWLMRRDGTVSWEVLMTALENIGLYSIAQDLEKASGNYWLPGADVIGLATASINRRFEAQLEWKEFGLTMNLILSEPDICSVTVAAGISGDFRIPSNTILVSAVYYIEISTDPSVSATAKCEVEVLNSHSKSSTVRYCFAMTGPPFTFDLGADDFTSRKLHGKIQLPKTPLVLAAFNVQSSGVLETEYSARVFSQRKGPTLWKLTVVIFPTLLAFEQVVKRRYPLTSQRKELVKLQFVFDTNETELTLDPEDSITSPKEDWTQEVDEIVENWCPQTTQREAFMRTVFAQRNVKMEGNLKIVPLKLNKISKQEIDKFHSAHYMLPTFEFMVQYSADSGELWQEESKFILRGAKPPQNFFRVDLNPKQLPKPITHLSTAIEDREDVRCHRIMKRQDLERVLAEIGSWEILCENLGVPEPVLKELWFAKTEDEVKKSRCLKAYLDTRTACWEQVVKVVTDFPFYNQRLAKMIADEHDVHYYYSEL